MKNIFGLLFLVFILIFTPGFKSKNGIILFNKQPVNEKNVLANSKYFSSGQRVYYLFLAPKRMKNEYIRVQIFKMTDKAPWGGYEVVRTKDFRLMKDERYYHSDYFVLYEKGRYVMQVFSTEDYQRPLSIGDFYIR